jgi:hypothetical protein
MKKIILAVIITLLIIGTPVMSKERLKSFDNVGSIRVWLNQWQYVPSQEWTTINGTTTFDPQANDCDKYSLQMVESGINDGYVFGLVVNAGQAHVLVMTLVGNQVYFIEPQDKSVFKVLNGNYWRLDK